VANLGFSARCFLGPLALALACGDGGGDGQNATTNEPAETSGEPTSAATLDDGTTASASGSGGSEESESSGAPVDTAPDDADPVQLRIAQYEVPTAETYYACFEFSFTLDQLGHVVGFVPHIDDVAHVHHFVLSKLDEPTGQSDGYQCFDLAGEMVWTWAPGGEDWWLPPEAGFLVGDGPGGVVTFRLQVHYNNPLGDAGAIDSSGLDLYVTKNLRDHAAGTMVFGDIAGIEIPPGEPAYEHVAVCNSQETEQLLDEPMHVFGTSMHAHNIGSVLWSDVYRRGEKAYEMNRDEPFLFGSQHMNKVDLIVEPGDEVQTHCVYDSSERTAVTIGGPGTENEMCWNLVTYWPRVPQPIDLCGSG
jgi:copper type II ascorbate-dependent monooxygenase-like protein